MIKDSDKHTYWVSLAKKIQDICELKYLLKELESNDCTVFTEKLSQLLFARASKTSQNRC